MVTSVYDGFPTLLLMIHRASVTIRKFASWFTAVAKVNFHAWKAFAESLTTLILMENSGIDGNLRIFIFVASFFHTNIAWNSATNARVPNMVERDYTMHIYLQCDKARLDISSNRIRAHKFGSKKTTYYTSAQLANLKTRFKSRTSSKHIQWNSDRNPDASLK